MSTDDVLGTEEVRELLDGGSVQLVDARSPDAYDGWAFWGEARGGHLPGARSMPARWARYIDWFDILASKDLDPARPTVVYGYEDDLDVVVDRFREAGFRDVRRYPGFLAGWTTDPDLPLERMLRYRHLVPPRWLHEALAGDRDDDLGPGGLVVAHCHYRNPDDHAEGHVPGAVSLDTLALESPGTWNRRDPDELLEALESHGIAHDATVVLTGRHNYPTMDDPFPGASAGQLAAMRCALILRYAGVDDVRVLNGGLRAWTDAGYALSTDPVEPPRATFGTAIPQRPELLVDTPEVQAGLADGSLKLVSVRSRPEQEGKVSGYHYIEARGRIPGAVLLSGGTDAYHMERYRNLDHTVLEPAMIEAMWREAGLLPDERIAFYCGTGWRAAEAWFDGFLLGWPNVSVYDGGWFEWSNDPGNPVETGPPASSP